eukprot:365837-Chlamydomonas_euryale.AAC.4
MEHASMQEEGCQLLCMHAHPPPYAVIFPQPVGIRCRHLFFLVGFAHKLVSAAMRTRQRDAEEAAEGEDQGRGAAAARMTPEATPAKRAGGNSAKRVRHDTAYMHVSTRSDEEEAEARAARQHGGKAAGGASPAGKAPSSERIAAGGDGEEDQQRQRQHELQEQQQQRRHQQQHTPASSIRGAAISDDDDDDAPPEEVAMSTGRAAAAEAAAEAAAAAAAGREAARSRRRDLQARNEAQKAAKVARRGSQAVASGGVGTELAARERDVDVERLAGGLVHEDGMSAALAAAAYHGGAPARADSARALDLLPDDVLAAVAARRGGGGAAAAAAETPAERQARIVSEALSAQGVAAAKARKQQRKETARKGPVTVMMLSAAARRAAASRGNFRRECLVGPGSNVRRSQAMLRPAGDARRGPAAKFL